MALANMKATRGAALNRRTASTHLTGSKRVRSVRPAAARACTPSCSCASCKRSVHDISCVCSSCKSRKTSANRMRCSAASAVAAPVTSGNTLPQRHQIILKFFPTALGVDDFIARVEIALCKFGFTGNKSIAMTNLCRDEVTTLLKDKIEAVFGSSFNTNGLGGVLTCGATGIGAGLSHSPVSDGRESYVFFSFPHIAIDASGDLGGIYRPGRPGRSCACGALQKSLNELKEEGVAVNCKVPGEHNPLDPEYSILKQRLARRIRDEALDIKAMNLAEITAVAERQITVDLEGLIEKAVDKSRADYAVITGVQIHNWAVEGTDDPHLEFVALGKSYVVVNGIRTDLDLMKLPVLPPRLISLLAYSSMNSSETSSTRSSDSGISTQGPGSTIHEIPEDYLSRRIGATFN